ncbi:glycine--tRNA ligase subunit alpha/beta [Candidatus Aerophobetes bacterium]|uniref:Multifunctional fusion protein n=1 Tax=Aerophobetes bacterium TaxID=2030807 RepID=A0A2A4X7D7_UNCAE|nr:MAG: glycine--tRNA ligase subunit alpha/beta [Candidatus Aerophobetes bacterium]
MLTFQKIIERLTTFWADRGCVVHTGCNVEVGAGTFNQATFLRSLGPEPYSCAYVEPSRRPQDGRFGENPNRLQLFHQFQVLIKPSPAHIQSAYLESLQTMGIKLEEHDIRFVHDDWESPTLGASGLGWEVWIDGMEVTQFTYFQIVAGQTLDPISVEITYGLERLCMIAQNKKDFFSMQYSDNVTYGEVFHRNEVEWSHYNFHHASTSMWQRHFEDYEQESQALIKEGFPIPAYEFTLKASHAFNMLEARGVLSVTERNGYITRVRHLAKECGRQYVQTREELGFPLLKNQAPEESVKQVSLKLTPAMEKLDHTSDFLLEIGSEELPATFVPIGMKNLEQAVATLLKKHSISSESIQVYGSARRLTLLIKQLSHGHAGQMVEKKGPPLALCFDQDGNLTPQGKGFFGSQNLPPQSKADITEISSPVKKKLIGKQDYLIATTKEPDTVTAQLLQEHLPLIIKNLAFPKKMRWGGSDFSYARPLEWILALFGKEVLKFNVGNYISGNTTWGHKQRSNCPLEITAPKMYLETLKKHYVLIDTAERKNSILEQLQKIESQLKCEAINKLAVLNEVLHLSEYPRLAVGDFSANFLKLPKEVIAIEMVNHQRYFPLQDASKKLLPHFIYTADQEPQELIKSGNERVLSARLRDGVFLYDTDIKTPLSQMAKQLARVTFHAKLGSILDKSVRIEKIAAMVAQAFGFDDQESVQKAAHLCKADLVSEMVGEFPELQGVMGKYYALNEKFSKQIGAAIEEHYSPKSDKAPLPKSKLGCIISISDRIDNLISHFSIGSKPTSSSDPFALRRHAIAIIKLLLEFDISLPLDQVIEQSLSLYPDGKQLKPHLDLLPFIYERMKGVLKEKGYRSDEIEAALFKPSFNPLNDAKKVKALHTFRKTASFNPLLEVFKRAKGQLKGVGDLQTDESLLTTDAEKNLIKAVKTTKEPFEKSLKESDYGLVFDTLAKLHQPLAEFYSAVKILDDNPKIRESRLALLKQVFSYFDKVLSFEKIQLD